MKIEKVKNENVKCFEDLAIGEAFYLFNHLSTDLYIKTKQFICSEFYEDNEEQEDDTYNAIKLSNGNPCWFSNFNKVVISNCKIVVE